MNTQHGTEHRYKSWKRKWDFLFTTAGFSIGLGNVWRFSYVCYEHGGGAFMLSYLILAIFFIYPVFLIEASLGQWRQQGMVKSWKFIPILKGIGFAQLYIHFGDKAFYCVLLVWILKYFFASFSPVLPWNDCSRWPDEICKTFDSNNTWTSNTTTNFTIASSAPELYWKNDLLSTSAGIDSMGSILKDNLLYLVIVWVLVYFAIFKGVNWAAKIAYITATLPAILILILVIRSLFLEGALDGIKEFLRPDFSKLASLELWAAAATQLIYSTGVCLGIIVSLRSHNNYNDNVARDAFIIIFGNFCTSFVSGLATFSTLGFMANYMNSTVSEVVSSGFGLVFITYPQTLSLLPLPQFWCALFFITLFLLGFDTQFAGAETLVATLIDVIPARYKPKKYPREIVSLFLCLLLFVVALVFVTQGGIYVVILLNEYLFFWNALLLIFCYYVGIGWFYGAARFWREVEKMVGPSRFKVPIIFVWKYVGPVISLSLAIQAVIKYKPITYGSYVYPAWANVLGHLLSAGNFACILIYAVYLCITSKKKLIELIRPSQSFEEEELPDMKCAKEKCSNKLEKQDETLLLK